MVKLRLTVLEIESGSKLRRGKKAQAKRRERDALVLSYK
jgi:hypothetical protein